MERAAPRSPIWPCTRWGFPCLRACAWSGGLLPHLFTLTQTETAVVDRRYSFRRFKFLWHCPSAGLTARPPAYIPFPPPSAATGYAASRPVVFGLSSPGSRRKRSSALPKSKNSLQPIGLRTESKSGIGGIRENLAPDFIVLDGSVGNKIPSEIRHEVHNPGTNACSHTMVFVPELLKRKRTYC